jgi:hypothetical protein
LPALVAVGCANASPSQRDWSARSTALVAAPERLALDETEAHFGKTVALTGDTALIGAGAGLGTYFLVHGESTWSAPQLLGPHRGALALSDDTALIGESRLAFAYARSESGWVEAQVLGDDPAGTYESVAISLSGDRALVGDWVGENPITYVYARSGGTWSQEQRLLPSIATNYAYFGSAVALSGDTALIGASLQDTVYVFVRSGTTWNEQQKLTPIEGRPVIPPAVNFGTAVALSGDTALVGAPTNASGTGAAFVFRRSGSEWKLEQRLTASDGIEADGFGRTVAVSDDLALVGSQKHGGHLGGAVYVFARGPYGWSQQDELVVHDEAPDEFGSALALSGRRALIGTPSENNGQGAAYVYDLSEVMAPLDAPDEPEPPTVQLEQERPVHGGCVVAGRATSGTASWLAALLAMVALECRRLKEKRFSRKLRQ